MTERSRGDFSWHGRPAHATSNPPGLLDAACAFSALTKRRFRQHNRAMVPRIATWMLAPLLFCGGCDQSRKLDDVRKSVDSWEATLSLISEQWTQHQVPTTFVREIVEAAGKALDEDQQRLAKVPADSYGARELQQRRLGEVQHRLHEMAVAVDRGDAAGATAAKAVGAPPGKQSETQSAGGAAAGG